MEFSLQKLSESVLDRNIVKAGLLSRGSAQEQLFELARAKRSSLFLSEEAEVRSVIEISNICRKKCNFCNINSASQEERYIIEYQKFMEILGAIHSKGRRVFLLQSGENGSQNYIDFLCKCIDGAKKTLKGITIILCLGNLDRGQYKQLKDAGADRYILKFETSNRLLYKEIKPDDSLEERLRCLEELIELGFEVGTGNIVGLPNQTTEDIIDDLFFISRFKLTMASCTTFIPGERSHYRNMHMGDVNITLNFMALLRIMYPWLLIPTTSSLEKALPDGQYLGLMAGANAVTIHDGTPLEIKKFYPIYSVSRFVPDEKHIEEIVSRAGLKLPKTEDSVHA